MSSKQTNNIPPKMCKSPSKLPLNNQQFVTSKLNQKTNPKSDLTYEVLSTNCTLVGSNNLNLDSKLSQVYPTPKINICSKPMKNADMKKNHPRAVAIDQLVHNQAKFGFSPQNQARNVQQSTQTMQQTQQLANFSSQQQKLVNFEGIQSNLNLQNIISNNSNSANTFSQQHQRTILTSKSSNSNFSSINSSLQSNLSNLPLTPANLNNGICTMSPSAYSNPSPNYPTNSVSPYNVQISSPANSVSSISSVTGVTGIKSPVASPQQIRPPTPQPILPQAFQQIPVMTSGANLVQIIHAPNTASAYQNHPVLTRQTIIGPPSQSIQQNTPLIKIKPPQNILPKPPSSSGASPQSNKVSGRTTISQNSVQTPQIQQNQSPAQIMLPNQTILPAAQPGTLLLNQMPLIVQQNTPHGVQLILRPSTPNSNQQLTAKNMAPQNLILQQSGGTGGPQVILQHAGAQRGATIQQPQQLVRVLTANGMIQQLAPTYIAMNNQLNLQQLTQTAQPMSNQSSAQPNKTLITQGHQIISNSGNSVIQNHQGLIGACIQAPVQNQGPGNTSGIVGGMEQLPPPKRKPKKKKKNKEKLDLGSIMKLSGIGDDDDVMFESDNSESTNTESNSISQIQKSLSTTARNESVTSPTTCPQVTSPLNSTPLNTSPLMSSSLISSPLTSAAEPDIPKRIGNIHITDITKLHTSHMNQISQATSQIGQMSQSNQMPQPVMSDKPFAQSQISVQQSLSDINAINQNLTQIGLIQNSSQNLFGPNNQILQSQMNNTLINQDSQNLANFLSSLQGQNFSLINNPGIPGISGVVTSQSMSGLAPKFSTVQTSQQNFPNLLNNLVTTNSDLTKSNATNFGSKNLVQNLGVQGVPTHFNIPNIQVQNFPNQNLILNQTPNAIITPNFPGNITINNGLMTNNLAIQNSNLTIPNTNLTLPNFLQTGLVQSNAENYANNNLQRTGGFKLALSEDGRLILQHDPNLNQDIQSQLLLQSIFGINLQGGNLVLTSVSQAVSQQSKPVNNEPVMAQKKAVEHTTKTTNIIQNVISSVKTTENQTVFIPHEHVNHISQSSQTSQVNQTSHVSHTNQICNQIQQTALHNNQHIMTGQTLNSQHNLIGQQSIGQQTMTAQQTITAHQSIIGQQAMTAQQSIPGQQMNQSNLSSQIPPPQNAPYVVNLTPDQLEQLKRNGQVSVNGQIIYMQRPVNKTEDKNLLKSPKNKPKKKFEPKKLEMITPTVNTVKSQTIQTNFDHLNSQKVNQITSNLTQANQTIISQLQSPIMTGKIASNQSTSQNIEQQKSQELDQILSQKKPGDMILIQQPDAKPDSKCNHDFQNDNSTEKPIQFINGSQDMNVEQFLSNLNINSTNLSQLISQKLSQELPNVDHKILNIQAGPNAGQLVAKIDISSSDMSQIMTNDSGLSENMNQPFIQMTLKQENDVFGAGMGQVQNNESPSQMPALVISGLNAESQSDLTTKNTVYQRIQTIQLTPQKQQLLKSVQLQIQALTARLQQKDSKPDKTEANNIPENDIQNALRHLYLEQQKILASGKVLPSISQPITSVNCNMETISTQSGPVVSTPSKNNGPFITSLLQQPAVSSNQSQKIYYHNGNQIITLNSSNWQPNHQNILPSTVVTSSVPTSTNQTPLNTPNITINNATSQTTTITTPTVQNKIIKKMPCSTPVGILPLNINTVVSTQAGTTFVSSIKNTVATTSDKGCQMSPQLTNQICVKNENLNLPNPVANLTTTATNLIPQNLNVVLTPPKPRIVKPTYSKAQLIEQQLLTDQNGANNPDINTPFASKADACKRLVRYHCYNQQVLSQKDLDKADEIFELTAKHFIGKFQGMINKYKYLLLKESMREVQTSELMMIDRMFLAEEQQSFLKLQSDLKLQNDLEAEPDNQVQQNRSGIFQNQKFGNTSSEDIKPDFQLPDELIDDFVTVKQENESDKSDPVCYEGGTNTDFNIKCGLNYFSDESCDSENFRVYESPSKFDEFLNKDFEQKQKSDKNKVGVESYNTTKIIGNFEIEINNKSCNSQESYTKNFRQKIIDNKSENRKNEDNFEKSEDYDEWLCIQRELGYVSENSKTENKEQSDSVTSQDMKKGEKGANKRSSSENNRLETLKKFRVEKHNSKTKKSGSIIGEVKFEVRIEHKKVFAEQTATQKSSAHASAHTSQKRAHYEFQNKEQTEPSKRSCNTSVRNEASNVHHAQLQIKQEDNYIEDNFPDLNESSSPDELIDTSIDEQVQSAIDSILNLQQIASMSEQKDPLASSTSSGHQSHQNLLQGHQNHQTVTCRNINTLTNYGAKSNDDDLETFSDTTDTLDEAVKSILS